MPVEGRDWCSEAIFWSCGCKSHHCNSHFGNVLISDSGWSDPNGYIENLPHRLFHIPRFSGSFCLPFLQGYEGITILLKFEPYLSPLLKSDAFASRFMQRGGF